MSGGVDSAVAAAILVQAGFRVVGVTLRLWTGSGNDEPVRGCCSLAGVQDARETCADLGIEHYVADVSDVFTRQVVDPFVEAYARGKTPSPCTACNAAVRFDAMLSIADSIQCRFVATGHYAQVRRSVSSGRFELLRAKCPAKDQSYMLYALSQAQLSRVLFPLGEFASKEQVRHLAHDLRLHVARRADSQDICFVGAGGYAEFIRKRNPALFQPGPIVDERGNVIGRHEGIGAYTIGQRRRLPASNRGPLFVTRLDAETNTVIVGPAEALFSRRLVARPVNWVSMDQPSGKLAVQAQIRYNAEAAPATIEALGDTIVCRFDRPQRAVTPGQAVVFYDAERVVAGGIIAEAHQEEDNP
jgi:tRNA-specific 2-thiouridylase